MFNPLKILFVSPEVTPFAKTGGLADVAGALPKALRTIGCDVRIIMPLYRSVYKSDFNIRKIKSRVSHARLKRLLPFDIYEYREKNATVYFVDNRDYFHREELYGTSENDYEDNAYRFAFFSMAALTVSRAVHFKCNIIHCNDWQSALVPFYLKFRLNKDRFYKDTKTLYTIHNLAYQGQFPRGVMDDIDISDEFFNMHNLEFYGKINFMKSGILYSDAVSTVSNGYAKEILTAEYGCGLEGVLKTRRKDLFGITNGVDYSDWNPEVDKYIKVNYGFKSVDKKAVCKKDLLEHVGMNLSLERPLLGVITRLARQKGIDLLADIMEKLVALDVGVILLGRGDEEYQNLFTRYADLYPEHLNVNIKFDDELAHKIEAGCDMFLMPSRYEPCGLNQMYSLKYGTIPIVRATGGLDDIITDIDTDAENGNGFKFSLAAPQDFYEAIERAVKTYENKAKWNNMVRRVMQSDFSWGHSAKEYIKLYENIINRRML